MRRVNVRTAYNEVVVFVEDEQGLRQLKDAVATLNQIPGVPRIEVQDMGEVNASDAFRSTYKASFIVNVMLERDTCLTAIDPDVGGWVDSESKIRVLATPTGAALIEPRRDGGTIVWKVTSIQ